MPRFCTYHSKIIVADTSQKSGVMGTAQEAAAVVQGGFAGLTTGATIFGFSLRRSLRCDRVSANTIR